jgi:hypothetical protein
MSAVIEARRRPGQGNARRQQQHHAENYFPGHIETPCH